MRLALLALWLASSVAVAQPLDLTVGCPGGAGDTAGLLAALKRLNTAPDAGTLDGGAGLTPVSTNHGWGPGGVIRLVPGCEYLVDDWPRKSEPPPTTDPNETPYDAETLFFWMGPNAFPLIVSDTTIEGNGATIRRVDSSGVPSFRFFSVAGSIPVMDNDGGTFPPPPGAPASCTRYPCPGKLTLRNLTLAGGLATGGHSDRGGAGAGLGGAVLVQGELVLANTTFVGNRAQGGQSADAPTSIPTQAFFDTRSSGAGLGGSAKLTVTGNAPLNSFSGGGGFVGNGTYFPAGALGDAVLTVPMQLGDPTGGGTTKRGGGSSLSSPWTDGPGSAGSFGGGGGAVLTATNMVAFAAPFGGGGAIGPGGFGGGGAAGNRGGFGAGGGGCSSFGVGCPTGAPGFGAGPAKTVTFTVPGVGTSGVSVGGNGAGLGGAVFIHGGSVTATNTTFADNQAITVGAQGLGSAIFNLDGRLTLRSTTISGGVAVALYARGERFESPADGYLASAPESTLSNTLIVGPACDASDDGTMGLGPRFTTSGNVLAGSFGACAFALGVNDAGLPDRFVDGGVRSGLLSGSLADNGGLTFTLALAANGGAADAGVCAEPVDQRGVVRVLAPLHCDVGAFELTRTKLSLAIAGDGTGTVNVPPGGVALTRDFPPLVATAAASSEFRGWDGGGCSGVGVCVVPAGLVTVAATFELKRLAVSVLTSGSGAGTLSSGDGGLVCDAGCSQLVRYGEGLVLRASPAADSTFGGWSGACGADAGDCVLQSVTAAQAVTARFDRKRYPVSVTKAGSGSGWVVSVPAGIDCESACATQSATYEQGGAVVLVAMADPGSTFVGWSGDCTGLRCSWASHTGPKSVTATFTVATGAGGSGGTAGGSGGASGGGGSAGAGGDGTAGAGGDGTAGTGGTGGGSPPKGCGCATGAPGAALLAALLLRRWRRRAGPPEPAAR